MTAQDVMSLLAEVNILREQHQFKEALQLAKKVFIKAPRDPKVLFLLGVLHLETKEYVPALKFLTTAIALDPTQKEFYLYFGRVLLAQGKNLEAERVFKKQLSEFGSDYLVYYYLGKALNAQNKLFEALEAYQKGMALKEDFSSFHHNIAILLHKLGKRQEAILAYQDSLRIEPDNIALLSNYGALLSQDRQFQESIEVYEKALSLNPNHLGTLSNLAVTYLEREEFKKAEKLLRKSLEIAPNQPPIWRNVTLCVQYDSVLHPDILKIKQLMDKETQPSALIHYYFALGKIYFDCKEYDKAIEFYEKGNALREREAHFKPHSFKLHISLIIKLFSEKVYRRFTFKKRELPNPIFIIGTPRSGKSLLETFIAEHPHVRSAGEVGFAETIAKCPKSSLPKGNYPFWVKDFSVDEAKVMRKAYLRRLLQHATHEDKYVIDTLPGNFMYLGVLAMLFPEAKFIHCKRNAEDACLLMHFKYFSQGHSYTNSLSKLGSYYQQYLRLMEHWQTILPGRILEVQYEDLILDPTNVLKEVSNHLQLQTSVAFDIGKLHRSEIDIHKKFAAYLNPLQEALHEQSLEQDIIDVKGVYLSDLMNSSRYYYKQGDLQQAERLVQDLLEELPENPDALYLLGLIYIKKSLYQEAIYYLEKTLLVSPRMIKPRRDLAFALKETGKHLEADKQLKIVDKLIKENKEPVTLSLDAKNVLLNAFSEEVHLIEEDEVRLLLKKEHEDLRPDSFLTKSWDRYFSDLSFGSFRSTVEDENKVWRMRTWHFLFKNMALVNHIYNQRNENIHILDLGCSSGYLRRFIEGNYSPDDTKNIYYWGLDVREESLLQAVKGVNDIESGASGNFIPSAFLVHDFKDPLPIKDNHFDYVVSFEAIKYLPVAQGKQLLKEMHRVIKEDGRLFLSTSFTLNSPGFMETVPFFEIENMLKEIGFDLLHKRGSQGSLQELAKHLKQEHVPFVNELLKVHPPEMVAAMVIPLYPSAATQVTFVCKKRASILRNGPKKGGFTNSLAP